LKKLLKNAIRVFKLERRAISPPFMYLYLEVPRIVITCSKSAFRMDHD
jgi:hypothetical protein